MNENILFCPFDKTHVVNIRKFQLHVIKCKQKHPEIKLASCMYNYIHMVKPEDLHQHYRICPDKVELQRLDCFKPVVSNHIFPKYGILYNESNDGKQKNISWNSIGKKDRICVKSVLEEKSDQEIVHNTLSNINLPLNFTENDIPSDDEIFGKNVEVDEFGYVK